MMKECKTISINNVLWQYKAINSRGFESPTFRKVLLIAVFGLSMNEKWPKVGRIWDNAFFIAEAILQ